MATHTVKVSRVPKHIRANLDSAWNTLIDSDSLPGAFQHNASRYFLLLLSWELYQTAQEEFSAWVKKEPHDPRLLRDHGYKLRRSPNTKYIKIVGGKPIESDHKTEDEKKKLRQWLQYGDGRQTPEKLFERGCHFDTFRNTLIGNINMLRVTFDAIDQWAKEDARMS